MIKSAEGFKRFIQSNLSGSLNEQLSSNTIDSKVNSILSPSRQRSNTRLNEITPRSVEPQTIRFKVKRRNEISLLSSHPNFNPKMKKSQSSLLLLSEGKRTIENGLFYKNGSCPRMKKMNVCIGDYEIKKKEKYVIQRNSYLMKSTRDIFLRYKNKIELKRVKLKMIN